MPLSVMYILGVTPGTLLPDRTYVRGLFREESKSIGNLYSTPRAAVQLAGQIP